MHFRDIDYPTVEELKQAVREFVRHECEGMWPEDEWFDVGEWWSVNVWEDSGRERITVYRDTIDEAGLRTTDTSTGIRVK